MKFAYDKSKAQRIINHEGIMLEAYAKIISSYSPLFEQYKCSIFESEILFKKKFCELLFYYYA